MLSPRDEPYSFTVGKCEVPKGLEIGIANNFRFLMSLNFFPRDWTGLNFESIMNEAENIRSTNMLHLNVAACLLKMGEWRKSIETCNKVVEAKSGHVKGLYRRGMAYMVGGDYEDARNDFNMMIKAEKKSEADAKAALLKLKQKEQEAESKARKQFKGLFDKKLGEITELGSEIREESNTIEEVDETKDDDDETQQEERTITETKKKWSEKAMPFLKNVGLQLGVALLGYFILQFFSSKFT